MLTALVSPKSRVRPSGRLTRHARVLRRVRTAVVLAAVISLGAGPVTAQCNTAGVSTMQYGSNLFVFKCLTDLPVCIGMQAPMALSCSATAGLAPGYGCCPSGGMTCRRLVAITNTMNLPTPVGCSFVCAGCTSPVTVDNSDGLPVELLGFSVEPGDAEPEDAEGGDAAEGAGPEPDSQR